MGNGIGQIKEERIFLIDADEIRRGASEPVVGIFALHAVGVAPQLPFALVAPEELGIIIVRVRLIEVAEPLVKSVLVRVARCSFVAQTPFAVGARDLTVDLNDTGYGHVPASAENSWL